ncbi:hypothetical protein FSP39_013970 [Pinctada imbricata]|uniref:Calmodulin-lysine N-methyltransferase n=1 Tax=Pinctada imbricata TaxID=66713 RepID=A0AA88XWP7_PINIB|nr:hypothetical protein FSP39_013970 [Pinctada imbricata]
MNKNALEDEPTKKRKEHEEEEEDDDENDFEKKRRYQIAMQRWAILKQALLGGKSSETCKSSVSVRRFSSFGLLQTEYLFSNNKEETWYQYTCADFPNFKMTIKHLPGKINANSLNGFNNTGNVCVWPSEEVMAYYCIKNLDEFRNKNIIELGGGMTCLAGVAVSILSEAQSVVLTDGNEESIDNLTDILNDKSNAELLRKTKVSSRMLRWGEGELDKDLRGHFDIIICADCLFFDEGREDLVQLVYDLLKPNGKCWMFAPKRGATFDEFKQAAEEKFHTLEEERFEKKIYDLHCKLKESGTDQYDPNIHFPIHLQLTKKDVS